MGFREEVTDEDIKKLPRHVYFRTSPIPVEVLWSKHLDGTVSFVSFRLTKGTIDRLKEK